MVCTQSELQLPVSQALALFVKIVKKISKRLDDVQRQAISAEMPEEHAASRIGGDGSTTKWKPVEISLTDELKNAGDEVTKSLREKQRQMIDSLDLSK